MEVRLGLIFSRKSLIGGEKGPYQEGVGEHK
jgi:hypothetical protein